MDFVFERENYSLVT